MEWASFHAVPKWRDRGSSRPSQPILVIRMGGSGSDGVFPARYPAHARLRNLLGRVLDCHSRDRNPGAGKTRRRGFHWAADTSSTPLALPLAKGEVLQLERFDAHDHRFLADYDESLANPKSSWAGTPVSSAANDGPRCESRAPSLHRKHRQSSISLENLIFLARRPSEGSVTRETRRRKGAQ